jgi:hypothetical protein
MLLRVIHAEYIKGHQLLIQFNNGKSVYVDLAQEFDGNFFQKFSIVGNTIEWPNGADFAPEFLYEIGTLASEHARRKVAEDSPTYGHR